MRPLPLNVIYYGAPEPLPPRHDLRAGPLSAVLEHGQLLDIRWRGRDVLSRIYVAVRDKDWGTVPLRLSGLEILHEIDSFHVAFDARHRQDEIDFEWKASIEGHAVGQLSFSMEGGARSTFLRSRIGFCLLNSARDCAGRRFDVVRPNGTRASGSFPELISQQQPVAGHRSDA